MSEAAISNAKHAESAASDMKLATPRAQGRFWLAESAFALLSQKVTKAKLLIIYKEDYEEDD